MRGGRPGWEEARSVACVCDCVCVCACADACVCVCDGDVWVGEGGCACADESRGARRKESHGATSGCVRGNETDVEICLYWLPRASEFLE